MFEPGGVESNVFYKGFSTWGAWGAEPIVFCKEFEPGGVESIVFCEDFEPGVPGV